LLHDQIIEHGKMNMHPEKQTNLQRALPYLGSLALTAALFLALPLTQWAADGKVSHEDSEVAAITILPPPAPPPVEPPQEEEIQEEEVELEQEMLKISLSQIDLALNAGSGGMGAATFNLNSFQLADNFGDDFIFEVADLDEPPTPIVRNLPNYPAKLKRAGIQGRVWLIFIVDVQGNVGDARVVESSHPEFSESALTAVRSWKFAPGKKDGKAVKTRVRIPLSFSLRR